MIALLSQLIIRSHVFVKRTKAHQLVALSLKSTYPIESDALLKQFGCFLLVHILGVNYNCFDCLLLSLVGDAHQHCIYQKRAAIERAINNYQRRCRSSGVSLFLPIVTYFVSEWKKEIEPWLKPQKMWKNYYERKKNKCIHISVIREGGNFFSHFYYVWFTLIYANTIYVFLLIIIRNVS